MIEEKVLVQKFLNRKSRERLKKPDWLKIKLGDPKNQNAVLELIDGLNLHTVCQEAKCPNIFECWTDKTATFMLGGDTCTRHCGFCAVNKGVPMDLDPMEPTHVAEAVKHLDLKHAVITSVNRDDLPDGGSMHWAETITKVREMNPTCKVEVLIPDFNGDEQALNNVLSARPDVLNHNTETIARLYRRVRSQDVPQQRLDAQCARTIEHWTDLSALATDIVTTQADSGEESFALGQVTILFRKRMEPGELLRQCPGLLRSEQRRKVGSLHHLRASVQPAPVRAGEK